MGAWGSRGGVSCRIRCDGWASHMPSINHGLHSALLFIATLAPIGRFSALVFSSPLLHPWNVGSVRPEMRPRRGGPHNVVCSSGGKDGASMLSPFAAVVLSSHLSFGSGPRQTRTRSWSQSDSGNALRPPRPHFGLRTLSRRTLTAGWPVSPFLVTVGPPPFPLVCPFPDLRLLLSELEMELQTLRQATDAAVVYMRAQGERLKEHLLDIAERGGVRRSQWGSHCPGRSPGLVGP
jgi:hypothetical protein